MGSLSLVAEDVYDTEGVPALTSDNPSSDSPVLIDEQYDSLTTSSLFKAPLEVDQGHLKTTLHDNELQYPIPPVPNISSNWNSYPAKPGYANGNTGIDLDWSPEEEHISSYTPAHSLSMLEPSPTLRLITEFAKRKPMPEVEEAFDNTPVSDVIDAQLNVH